MSVQKQTKSVVTVAEMARMCGLSRARFHQLRQAGVFPEPVYQLANRRPVYFEDQQVVCLEVRRRNCGINGQPVLFYARRGGSESAPIGRKRKPKAGKNNARYAPIVEGVRALGLSKITASDVRPIVDQSFPNWDPGQDDGEVIRAVFLHLKRENSSDNVGR